MDTPRRRFSVRRARWTDDEPALRSVRQTVFMGEQCVPEALEWDGLDEAAVHLLAVSEDGQAIGTARLLADGHIGRMAVLSPWRRQGVGSALLQEAMDVARTLGLKAVDLDAQVHAIPFYERLGFTAEGEVFMDAGIPHRHMRRSL